MIGRIARREIVVRGRDKSTRISTLVTVAIIAAVILLPKAFGGTTNVAVAFHGAVPDVAAAEQALDIDIDLLRVRDDAAARRAVRDDHADAAFVSGGLVVGGSAPDATVPALQQVSRAQRARAPDPPPLPVERLDADAEQRQGFAAIALIVLYGQLIGYGFLVASGVVEEKASRIVEILLAVVRPRELLFGKVLGIGVVGLVQLLVIGVAGLLIGVGSGEVELGGNELGALPIVLGAFLFGYALYAGAFALAGALVSRQEDLQSVTTPLTLALLASFFLGFQAVDDPGGTLAGVLSYVPVSAPLVTPVRLIAGEMGPLEVLLSAAIVVATTYAVIAFAARVYGTAVLQTGGRVRLRALTSGRTAAP